MIKILIFEGPDNIGKTTLLKDIQEIYKPTQMCKYIHDGPPVCSGLAGHQEMLSKLEDTLKRLRHKKELHTEKPYLELWDRSALGECVYGPLFRGYEIDNKYWRRLDQLWQMENCDIMTVVFYADIETYEQWQMKTKQDEKKIYQKQHQAAKISQAFIELMTDQKRPNTIFVNCNNYDIIEDRNAYVVKRVDAWLNNQPYKHRTTGDYSHSFYNHKNRFWGVKGFYKPKEFVCEQESTCAIFKDHITHAEFGREYQHPTSGYGAIYAKWVFVGEAPGYNGCGKLGLPFYDDVSGNLFQTMLDELHILPTQVYVTNVIKCCPKNNKLGEFKTFKQQRTLKCVNTYIKDEIENVQVHNPYVKVVAVGNTAKNALSELCIKTHGMIKHPAYFCRIGLQKKYAEYCREILIGG